MISGFALLSVFITELVLSYLFSHSQWPTRFLYYCAAYVIIGLIYGCGIGIIHYLLIRFMRAGAALKDKPLFASMHVSGLIGLLGLIVLNASYLPRISMLSGPSIFLNALLMFLCIALLFCFYLLHGRINLSSSVCAIMGTCSSVAVVLAMFNAFVSRRIELIELQQLHAAGLLLLFLITGSFTAVADIALGTLMAGRKPERAEDIYFRRAFFARAITGGVLMVVFAVFLVLTVYKPLTAESGDGKLPTGKTEKPNIIIIVLDTVRQDRLTVYGCERETTPSIGRFAESSWIFDAYSTAGWTLPSHASIVTGRYPSENGTGLGLKNYIDPSNETMAEILRANGYSTAAIISNHQILHPSTGFAQGFDYYYAAPRENGKLVFASFAHYFFLKLLSRSPVCDVVEWMRAEEINRQALGWIRKSDGRPFFLFLNYMDAHAPYAPPVPYDRNWYNPPSALTLSLTDGSWVAYDENADEHIRSAIERERAYRLGQYDGEIAYLDAQIGILFDELRNIEAFDDSLIVVTSDHGEFFFEHGMVEHPPALYEGAVRVPLIVKPPAQRGEKPARISGKVSLVHLFHSVLEYVGIPHNVGDKSVNLFEGKSLSVFSEGHPRAKAEVEFIERFGMNLYSIIRHNHKLIYSSEKGYEFYNLSEDPLEEFNLYVEEPTPDEQSDLAQMKTELASRIKNLHANVLVPEKLSPEMQKDFQSRLKTLGYIQ